MEYKVTIKNKNNETLVGVESRGKNVSGKHPAVVLVHGFAYYKEEDGIFVELAKRLADIGIASYRFDFSGCGESEGDYANVTLTKLKDDLESILEYVRSRATVDQARLGIVAQSFGTTTTISLTPQIKSLVLMGSILNAKEVMKNLFGKGYNPRKISVLERSDESTVRIKPDFWQDFENHDLIKCVKQIKYPILLIHGSEDDHVVITEMDAIYQLANSPKEKLLLKGADHGLVPKREEMYAAVIKWFQKTLL